VMSVFKGRVTELPGLIVDHFSVSNCKYGRAFFLSHCHKGDTCVYTLCGCSLSVETKCDTLLFVVVLDHMTGLSSEELVITLRGR